MSVMCCRIPDFLIGLTARQQPEMAGQPVALLGADERVWAASAEARRSGVQLQMPARQARLRCPDVQIKPLDMGTCRSAQDAFLGTLAECGLPVESPAWGLAYVDLQAVAGASAAVRPYCADLGKQVRNVLGEDLQPAIGWDTGKFTARAAASYAHPGHMRLIDRLHEEHFLQPLSIDLLPLSSPALQQLGWLGIQTLGQFARLPTTAIWQRFGAEGKLAQQWARGRDDRPVRPTAEEKIEPWSLDFDPPTGLHSSALEAMLAKLRPELAALAGRMEGCRHLRLDLRFDDDSTRTLDCAFVEPVSDESRLRATLSHQLQILNWPAELASAKIALLQVGELLPRQLSLFPLDAEPLPFLKLAQKLAGRYGRIFFQPQLGDERHPLPERRMALTALSMGMTA